MASASGYHEVHAKPAGFQRLSFFAELKRRNVLKVGMAYLALGWLVVEVASTVTPLLHLPAWLPTVVLWTGIAGFPLVIVFSWIYEFTPEGIRREGEVVAPASGARRTARWLDYTIFGVLALAVIVFALHRFGPGGEAVPAAPEGAAARDSAAQFRERPAIAVLPFDNLSADPEQAFFADGLAEDLITRLSTWRAFPVIARNSSFQYRGGDIDVKRASAELGARYLVEGSVRSAGGRIRVNAQLIDAASGEHVWADTYDSEVADVFAAQDRISGQIAASLVGDLNRAEAERARQRGTESLEAWSLYQLGLQLAIGRYSKEEFAAARDLFTRAAQRDPRFAAPLAQRVFVDLWEAVMGWNAAPAETVAAALETARHAVEIDSRDPAAQAALGWAYVMSGDIENGLIASRRAVDINPSMPEAWGWLSWNLLMAGDPEGCIAAAEQAIRLNPLGPFTSILYDNFAEAYWELGDYEAGLRAARRLLAELPGYYFGHVFVAMNAVGLGRFDEARAAIAEGRRAQPNLSLELVQGIYGVKRPEIDARRNAALREAGLN
jgi:TolB-like protein/Tfp pilus assembly protein PilF